MGRNLEEIPVYREIFVAEAEKRQKVWDSIPARPTQFHAVPLLERAKDKDGNKWPWALEWHE